MSSKAHRTKFLSDDEMTVGSWNLIFRTIITARRKTFMRILINRTVIYPSDLNLVQDPRIEATKANEEDIHPTFFLLFPKSLAPRNSLPQKWTIPCHSFLILSFSCFLFPDRASFSFSDEWGSASPFSPPRVSHGWQEPPSTPCFASLTSPEMTTAIERWLSWFPGSRWAIRCWFTLTALPSARRRSKRASLGAGSRNGSISSPSLRSSSTRRR